MAEQKNNSKEKEQDSDLKMLQKENENLKKLLQSQQETLSLFQVQELSKNQSLMNQWLVQEITNIKNGINQIGLLQSDLVESLTDEQQDEIPEDDVEEEKNVEEKKEEPKIPSKPVTPEVPKKKGFFQKVGEYGKQVEKNLKEADPDKMLD